MYFLWKRTAYGSLRVSFEGLSGFVNRMLSGRYKCRSLSLSEGELAQITMVLYADVSAIESAAFEEKISSLAAPMGLSVHVIWADRGTPAAEWRETLSAFYQSPWTWMVLAAMIALGIIAGPRGLFWTAFWGTVAWFISKFVISFFLRRKLGFLPSTVRR